MSQQTIDPDALLAHARARYKAAIARSDRARSRTGVQTATREVYRDKSGGPFSWLFDGEDPDVVARDSRAIKRIFNGLEAQYAARPPVVGDAAERPSVSLRPRRPRGAPA